MVHYRDKACPFTFVKCSNILSCDCNTTFSWLQSININLWCDCLNHDNNSKLTFKNRKLKAKPHRNVQLAVLLYFCLHHLAPLKQLQIHTSVSSLGHLGFPHQASKDKKNAHLPHKIGHLLQGPRSISSDVIGSRSSFTDQEKKE